MIAEKDVSLQRQNMALRHRDQYIVLLEENLNLSKVQKFSASSEKLAYQIDLFDEAELEQAIDDIDALLPDELLTEAAVAAKKTRKRGFSSSSMRVRVELTPRLLLVIMCGAPLLALRALEWGVTFGV